ncbi:hypothetical protein NXW08_00270 [Bacteroides uniformis]|uniref:hypothetical protein n=1 Tax=Bacteroides uniformis TaxID=820 RepID=UPI0021652BB0|nr:hypothetical protein [Bacteroides uniformis]MCS2721891.1 hypothetical protein [Bacteroides uniformis]
MSKNETGQKVELKIGKYTFSFRKFQYVERMSEETYCFAADLMVDGRKLAACENNGHGGSTNVRVYPGCRELGDAVEAFLAVQPKVRCEEYDIELDVNLEYVADTLVEKELEAREHARIMRMTATKLVFRDGKGNYYAFGWKKQDIAGLLATPAGKNSLQAVIRQETARGFTVVNENIPVELLK